MKQSHFICTDQDLALFDIFPSFMEFLENLNIEIENENFYDFKHTYYDSCSKKFLHNGGYCRKTTYYLPDKTEQEGYLYEYRRHKKAPTLRFNENEKLTSEELSKVFGVNSTLIKPVRFSGHSYTASLTHKTRSALYYPHLDFVVQSGTIEDKYHGTSCDATFFSLVDTSAKEYNNYISNSISDRTDRIMALFNRFMSHYNLESISSNRYAELESRVTAASNSTDTADSSNGSDTADSSNN